MDTTIENQIIENQTNDNRIQLHNSWLTPLQGEFKQPYMQTLKSFLKDQKHQGRTIFPDGSEIFQALNLTPLTKTKVVILGQDPYHGMNQAHGLCFSVQTGTPLPPSLINIFKELRNDLGIDNMASSHPHPNGNLKPWSEQGVLLLNSVLTVEKGHAASHQGKGWEVFTDKIIQIINEQRENVVFLLWGSYAQKKGLKIDSKKHLVLKAPHPSPLSAHRGFLGCKHFSQTNEYLEHHQLKPIDWALNTLKN